MSLTVLAQYCLCRTGLSYSTGIQKGGVEITPFDLGMSELYYEA